MKLERILHVDDNHDMREIAKVALETVGGFVLHQCPDGFAAIDDIKAFRPDLLLLDVMMPKLNGPELYERIRKMPGFEMIPAVFLTVKAQEAFAKSLREQGAIGVVAKPFDLMNLAVEIKGIWNQRTLQVTQTNDFADEKVVPLRLR